MMELSFCEASVCLYRSYNIFLFVGSVIVVASFMYQTDSRSSESLMRFPSSIWSGVPGTSASTHSVWGPSVPCVACPQ